MNPLSSSSGDFTSFVQQQADELQRYNQQQLTEQISRLSNFVSPNDSLLGEEAPDPGRVFQQIRYHTDEVILSSRIVRLLGTLNLRNP